MTKYIMLAQLLFFITYSTISGVAFNHAIKSAVADEKTMTTISLLTALPLKELAKISVGEI